MSSFKDISKDLRIYFCRPAHIFYFHAEIFVSYLSDFIIIIWNSYRSSLKFIFEFILAFCCCITKVPYLRVYPASSIVHLYLYHSLPHSIITIRGLFCYPLSLVTPYRHHRLFVASFWNQYSIFSVESATP